MATWKRTGAVYGTAFLLALTCTPQANRLPRPRSVAPQEEEGLTDIGPMRLSGGPVPATPKDDQKRPPCEPALGEREIRSACYVGLLDVKPPCGVMYEHGGACFRPVFRAPRQPSSIQR